MEPGKRYRGYGWLNEYKEFCFEPEETGSRAGVIKPISSKDGVSLSATKKLLLVKVNLNISKDKTAILKELMMKMNVLFKMIREYDF